MIHNLLDDIYQQLNDVFANEDDQHNKHPLKKCYADNLGSLFWHNSVILFHYSFDPVVEGLKCPSKKLFSYTLHMSFYVNNTFYTLRQIGFLTMLSFTVLEYSTHKGFE